MFWLAITLLGLLCLGVVLIPTLQKMDWHNTHRQQHNIRLYQQQHIQYPELSTELAQRLLQDEQYNQEYQALHQISAVRFSRFFSLLLFLIIMGVSLAYYFSLPRYHEVKQGLQINNEQRQQLAQSSTQQKNNLHLVNVQNRLRQNPNDGENWYQLGQLYLLNNEFANALEAFSRSARLLGERPYILSAIATTAYYQAGQRITPQVKQLINQVLQQDPLDTATLSLLASDAFLQADYARALIIWQQILDSKRTNVDRRSIIESMQMAERLQRARE